MIYFIQVQEFGVIKIGSTSDLAKRMYTLGTACPGEIQLYGVIKLSNGDDLALETSLHGKYSNSNKIREWFYYDESMLREIESLEGFIPGEALIGNNRFRKGSFTPNEILEIDKLLRKFSKKEISDSVFREIGDKFGKHWMTIRDIYTGRSWSRVTNRPRIVLHYRDHTR